MGLGHRGDHKPHKLWGGSEGPSLHPPLVKEDSQGPPEGACQRLTEWSSRHCSGAPRKGPQEEGGPAEESGVLDACYFQRHHSGLPPAHTVPETHLLKVIMVSTLTRII